MIWSSWAYGQSPAELDFKSAYDHFTLQKAGSKYLLNGKPIKIGPFEEFLNMFRSQIEGSCPAKVKADLTVTAKVDGQPVVRKFFVADHVVSDGKQCATVNGEGIFYIPLHRSWFDENASAKIPIRSPFKITRGEETLAAFNLQNGDWRNTQSGTYPNWEFFGLFRDGISDFKISHRVHKAAVKGTPNFVLSMGGTQYKFYKSSNALWLAALPQTPWLVSSSRWSNWLDMDVSQWLDRNAPQLQLIGDKTKPLDERRTTLASLEGQWSPSIRDLLIQLLSDDNEDVSLKLDAIRMMKTKPIRDNIQAIMTALGKTEDADLLYALTSALKVRNPKGKVINTDLDETAKTKAVTDWQTWWNEYKDRKDAF